MKTIEILRNIYLKMRPAAVITRACRENEGLFEKLYIFLKLLQEEGRDETRIVPTQAVVSGRFLYFSKSSLRWID